MTTSTTRQTTMNDSEFAQSLEDISDIDERITALENRFHLKGQICADLTRGPFGTDSGVIWNVRLYLLDGRKEIATMQGRQLYSVLNRVFKDAWRMLKTTHGTTPGTRRAA